LDVLEAIASEDAAQAIIHTSLNDADVEVFHLCAEALLRMQSPAAKEAYLDALADENNVRINRAAYMLGQLGDPSAIARLIDRLVTAHKVVSGPTGRGAGEGYSTSFGDGGTSFQGGQSPKVYFHTVQNGEVLAALTRLAGGQTFGFDAAAWRRWHNAQKARGGAARLR
jgi:hypothetical protein